MCAFDSEEKMKIMGRKSERSESSKNSGKNGLRAKIRVNTTRKATAAAATATTTTTTTTTTKNESIGRKLLYGWCVAG